MLFHPIFLLSPRQIGEKWQHQRRLDECRYRLCSILNIWPAPKGFCGREVLSSAYRDKRQQMAYVDHETSERDVTKLVMQYMTAIHCNALR
jgi:hypothetical protein